MWVGMSLAGSGLGVQQIANRTWTPIRRPGFDSSHLNTSVLYQDHEGTLWIGTVDHGLYRIKGDSVDHFDTSDGLSGDSVSQIMEGHEGNVWITTGEGLDRFRALPVATYSMKQGLASPVVSSVFASRTGELWVATGAGIDILHGGNIRHLTAANGLPGKVARSVFQASDGTFWIAVDDKLVAYSKNSMRTINLPSGKPFGSILSITEDRDHCLWVVTMGDTTTHVYRISGFHTQEEAFPSDLPPSVLHSRKARGWLVAWPAQRGSRELSRWEADSVSGAVSRYHSAGDARSDALAQHCAGGGWNCLSRLRRRSDRVEKGSFQSTHGEERPALSLCYDLPERQERYVVPLLELRGSIRYEG